MDVTTLPYSDLPSRSRILREERDGVIRIELPPPRRWRDWRDSSWTYLVGGMFLMFVLQMLGVVRELARGGLWFPFAFGAIALGFSGALMTYRLFRSHVILELRDRQLFVVDRHGHRRNWPTELLDDVRVRWGQLLVETVKGSDAAYDILLSREECRWLINSVRTELGLARRFLAPRPRD